MKKEQYAIKGYFFGKNYRDLGNTIKTSFKGTWHSFIATFAAIGDAWSLDNVFFAIGLTIFYVILAIARFVFGFLFTILFSIFHIVVVTIVMIFVYLGFVTVAFIDKIYRTFKKVSNNCPNCQKKYDFPVYHCPNCGAPHRYLYPSSYGIFTHKCTCGTKLPTLLINGRHKLKSTCPHCGNIAIPGVFHSTLFPVFGGRSSGKTCFINGALTEIEQFAEKSKNLEYSYFYGVAGDERKRFEDYAANGNLPESTHDNSLVFYNFYLSPKNNFVKNFISLCDISGEVFQSRQEITKQVGYRYADAVIFVLDPLSIPSFRDELVEAGYDVAKYGGSDHAISDILSAMLTSLNEIYRKKNWKLHLVVAFTKSDIPMLDKYIGAKAIKEYRDAHKNCSVIEARDALLEKFLIEHDEANALNMIKNHFVSAHFFPTSAVGKNHKEGTAFEPVGNADPVLWAIDRPYKNLNFKSYFAEMEGSELC